MLSRTASDLFWMSRYVERAENAARMLHVSHEMSLLPQSTLDSSGWHAILICTGTDESFQERYGATTDRGVLRFMTLDADNPSSIYSSIYAAREAARAVRGDITTEMWETLNTTWLEVRDRASGDLGLPEVDDFLSWVKDRSNLFRGVTFATMLQHDPFHFTRLGTFLERADNTARILDVKYHVLLPSVQDVGGAADYYQWGALLRSVSAFQSYRRIYRDVITPRRVAELLILRADMPRSLHACLDHLNNQLPLVGRTAPTEAERLAGEVHARLHYGRTDHIFNIGLHEYLTDFLARINQLGDQINQDFFVAPACA